MNFIKPKARYVAVTFENDDAVQVKELTPQEREAETFMHWKTIVIAQYFYMGAHDPRITNAYRHWLSVCVFGRPVKTFSFHTA